MTNKKRMDEAAKKIATVYVQYGHILHDHLDGLRPLDLLVEAIDLLSPEEENKMGQNLELAAKKGVTSCMNGKKKQDCPYPKGSASRRAWNFGYDKIKEEK